MGKTNALRSTQSHRLRYYLALLFKQFHTRPENQSIQPSVFTNASSPTIKWNKVQESVFLGLHLYSFQISWLTWLIPNFPYLQCQYVTHCNLVCQVLWSTLASGITWHHQTLRWRMEKGGRILLWDLRLSKLDQNLGIKRASANTWK